MRLQTMGPLAGWSSGDTAERHHITDAGVDVKPNEDISGLEIELDHKVTVISGPGRPTPAARP